jgi:nitrite reductase/ring-hydroxylating ferredoxin subunit
VDSLTPLCASSALPDGGEGLRFELERDGKRQPAFAIRFHGRVYAYLNLCAHRGVELDWDAGKFFDITRHYLICATHGALYDPPTGRCVRGPCVGLGLVPVEVKEADGQVWLSGESGILVK